MKTSGNFYVQEDKEPQTNVNISGREREISLVGGLVLLNLALMKRGRIGIASAIWGITLLYRAISGISFLYRLINVNRAVHSTSAAINVPHEQGHTIRASITIDRPIAEIYMLWCDFNNLAQFMPDLKSVEVQGETRSHWVVDGPLGMTVEWDAEIIADEPYKSFSWRSLKNPYVDHAGSVHFKPAPGDQGVEVRVEMKYLLTTGAAGEAFAAILGHSPKEKVVTSLSRLKQILELGTIPTTDGQTSSNKKRSSK